MTSRTSSFAALANTIRVLSAEAVQKANSGHPGMPMGMADAAAVLWSDYLQFNPQDPAWLNRDRFVLSAGHGSMLLYSLLHLFGFDLPLDELKRFRQWGSRTPGHPEFGLTPGVETTTGPLGAGFSNGVGLALSGKLLGQRYGTELFNYRVFGIVSDGDLMEGVASEAASLAAHLKLGNIIYLYDDNNISIGGRTDITFTENAAKRFEAYGWHVQHCAGDNYKEISSCLNAACAETEHPSIISVGTIIGRGSPNKQDTPEAHGAPLGEDELNLVKKQLNWPLDQEFFVPEEVIPFCRDCTAAKRKLYADWQEAFKNWTLANGDAAQELSAQIARTIPEDLKQELIASVGSTGAAATRVLSGKAIQIIAKRLPAFIGGSADLEPSNNTLVLDAGDIQAPDYSGRNIRFGVREHAMGGIANGLAYSRSWIPYTGTFLVFSDYMRPAIRLAAISHLQVLFIFTHDSFYLGEDGPTHQPIEHISSLRVMPNVEVFRPADGMESALCYWAALNRKTGPSILLFTRQKLPALERSSGWQPDEMLQGAYLLSGSEHRNLVLVATGSEVSLTVEAAKLLAAEGIGARVVSMPCVERFLAQPAGEREKLIPPGARKVSIEAAATMGWERVVGSDGLMIGRDDFGASAPAEELAERFGFVPKAVVARIKNWLEG